MKKTILSLLVVIGLIGRVSASTLYLSTFWGLKTVDSFGNVNPFAQTGFNLGVALDANGNIYTSDWDNNKVYKVTSNGVVSVFASGGVLNQPGCMAFDSTGNLYVANQGNSTIAKISSSGSVSTFIDTGWTFGALNMNGMAFDTTGNLYVGNGSSLNITKITPTGTLSVFATDLLATGMAFDSNGNLVVGNALGAYTLLQVSPTGSVSLLSNNNRLSSIYGMAFDKSGNLFFSNDNSRQILELMPDGSLSTYASSYTLGAVGLAFSEINLASAPEPSTYALFGIGAIGLLMVMRRRKTNTVW